MPLDDSLKLSTLADQATIVTQSRLTRSSGDRFSGLTRFVRGVHVEGECVKDT